MDAEIAKQGLGYLLFVGTFPVMYLLWKNGNDKDKLYMDKITEILEKNIATQITMTKAVEAVQKGLDRANSVIDMLTRGMK